VEMRSQLITLSSARLSSAPGRGDSAPVETIASPVADAFGSLDSVLDVARAARPRELARVQQEMLEMTASLCPIDLTCGFAGQTHFSSLFRHFVGQTARKCSVAPDTPGPERVRKPRERPMPASPLAYRSDLIDRRNMLRLALAAGAAAAAAISGAPARAADAAAEPIALLGSSLVRLMQNGGSPFARRFAQFAPVVDQIFDLQAILRTSVGAHWDTMNVGEQADLMKVYRQYTVARFVANFDKYHGEQFRITGTRDVPGGEKVVETQIGSTQISFVTRQSSACWHVVDVLADGSISQVATQRSDFRATLSRGGGQALAASLQRKVSDLSGGSLA